MKILSKEIAFDPVEHKYTEIKTGKELISVTTLISKFKQEFDKDGSIIKRCAEREGISVEEMKNQWEKVKLEACIRGTSFHEQVEQFIKTGNIVDGPDKDIVEKFAKIKFHGELKSEQVVYSLKDYIAGTVDLIEINPDKSINILDFKTNKELKKKSFFDRKKRRFSYMLPPVQHLQDCSFNNYQLQLNLYAYLLEEKGFWIDTLTILYINPKTRDVEIHDVQEMRKEIKQIIHYYKNPPKVIKPKNPFDF